MNAGFHGQVLPLRDDARVARALFEQFALAVAPRRLTRDREARLRLRMLGLVRECTAPAGTRTFRAGAGIWCPLALGVDIKLLKSDAAANRMVALIRMHRGATFAPHLHPATEECLVLSGEIRIGSHRLGAGDVHVADAGTWHETTYSPRGALLLIHAACPSGSCRT